MIASDKTRKYFDSLKKESLKQFQVASKARAKGYDPKEFVEVKLAENLAERVIGLISAVAPQLADSGAIKRILELEDIYSPLDWRVALKIAHEISDETFCSFKDKTEAMEIGIRTGFAYVTLGVVSAPLEGFTSLEIKQRRDGKEYFCLNYAGPVRAAGGTAAAVSVIIADYVRNKQGYAVYDPTEKEVQRCYAELEDYHEYITNLQYFPSKDETEFLLRNIPVEISGDPSEKYEISSALLKDLPRIPTNRLRSGYCLIHSSCIPLKGPKLWAKIKKWKDEMDMAHWEFMEEFLKIQTKNKSKSSKKAAVTGLAPDFTYIADLVGGRPVLGHPLRNGGFRLRYGRSRLSGFSGQSIHPATMIITNNFVATGTQLKVERPGKAAAFTPCDTIEGPIIKNLNGDVIKIRNESDAKLHKKEVLEILYLGDVLINYGDFFDRAHKLVPAGYCEEIWIQHLDREMKKRGLSVDDLSKKANVSVDSINFLFKDAIMNKPSLDDALSLSYAANVPLHPFYLYYWESIKKDDLLELIVWFRKLRKEEDRIILRKNPAKRHLEILGVPHLFVKKEFIVINKDDARILDLFLSIKGSDQELKKELDESKSVSEFLTSKTKIIIKDKCGTFIGARMGRPEKAKMRKLTGSPHALFPVGDQGGRLRSFQAALVSGNIIADVEMRNCASCNITTPFKVCEVCDCKTSEIPEEPVNPDNKYNYSKNRKVKIDIKSIFENVKKKLKTNIVPDLIKGVRGLANKEHIPEHIIKGILRAKHGLSVNKDGTVRYDCSELPITHFKPLEVGVSISKLLELGYDVDIYGEKLERNDQILELKVQDILLPCCPESPEEPADEILFRVTKFVDETLEKLYDLPPFYNLEKKEDLVGHLTIGLAPHTSAGIVTRIVGFSKTQGFLAHPYVHAAMRRDCDGDESCILLLMDSFLNFSKLYLPSSRGSTMDAPLVLTSVILPAEVDDMVFNMDIVDKYPLELYEAGDNLKMPFDIKIKKVSDVMGTEAQYEGFMFTHDTTDLNAGVLCSSYKLLPSMGEKVQHQMDIAEKIRAVDESDVARLIIEKHFIRDTKGNLRKFSTQEFRCVNCNEKYRRPPLAGKCSQCAGKIIFTISQGSIVKYLELSMMLGEKYKVSPYVKQTLELTKRRIEAVFGKEKEKQTGLNDWLTADADEANGADGEVDDDKSVEEKELEALFD
jgi:DNA polymerase II large subunit